MPEINLSDETVSTLKTALRDALRAQETDLRKAAKLAKKYAYTPSAARYVDEMRAIRKRMDDTEDALSIFQDI